MLKLFHTPGSCSVASHIALEETGAAYDPVRVDFATGDQLKPAFLQINPKGRVPALATDRGVVTENPAILAYVAQSFPEAGLADLKDPFAFAQVQAFNMFIATNIHISFRQISRPETYADGPEAKAALKAKVPEKADEYFTVIEDQLSDGRTWAMGERYTTSDPYLFVFATLMRLMDVGHPKRFPRVQAHREQMLERPAVRRTLDQEELHAWWTASPGGPLPRGQDAPTPPR